ncbi:MAG: RuvC family protein [Limisphaerales bacterium]
MTRPPDIRVLAIDPTTKGFAFAVLEGPDRLVDWGTKTTTARGHKQAECLSRIRLLLELYQPSVVVLEHCAVPSSRRCPRVKWLIERIRTVAKNSGVKARLVSRAQVRRMFAPARTKHEIAVAIAQRFPELASILPRPRTRKTIDCEDGRMNIFDALALGLAFLHRGNNPLRGLLLSPQKNTDVR